VNKKTVIISLFFIFLLNVNVKAEYAQALIEHVKKSIRNAYIGDSKLNNDILMLNGMSSSKVRHLLNNLCALPEASYLEIGVWQGSTFISALYQNTSTLSDI